MEVKGNFTQGDIYNIFRVTDSEGKTKYEYKFQEIAPQENIEIEKIIYRIEDYDIILKGQIKKFNLSFQKYLRIAQRAKISG